MILWRIRRIQQLDKVVTMECPESPNTLLASLFAQFVNGKLFNLKAFGKFVHGENLNELMALHDIILLDTTTLCRLLEVNERHA